MNGSLGGMAHKVQCVTVSGPATCTASHLCGPGHTRAPGAARWHECCSSINQQRQPLGRKQGHGIMLRKCGSLRSHEGSSDTAHSNRIITRTKLLHTQASDRHPAQPAGFFLQTRRGRRATDARPGRRTADPMIRSSTNCHAGASGRLPSHEAPATGAPRRPGDAPPVAGRIDP